MIVVTTKRLKAFSYNSSLKIPSGITLFKACFYNVNHFFFECPSVMVKHPFAITDIYMHTWITVLSFHEDYLEILAVV